MMSKTIVVIGASTGIGKAIVQEAAKNPENEIFAFARQQAVMQSNFKELRNVTTSFLDLEQWDQNLFLEALKNISHIDVLINNAGFLVKNDFDKLSHQDFIKSYQINVIGIMQVVQACIPKMTSSTSHIVNISSMGGFQGSVKFPGLAAYSTSKAALCSFTELFAEEYKDSNIHMNCLCLGAVQTEMLEEAFPGFKAPHSAAKMAAYIYNFSLTQGDFMNGKIIPVSLSTP
jgi:short-subunit dehydrogenase|tara:strand:+ start:15768 stop:16460 length:693 start_codon:yes stop_codon:yes gene_type:complete